MFYIVNTGSVILGPENRPAAMLLKC